MSGGNYLGHAGSGGRRARDHKESGICIKIKGLKDFSLMCNVINLNFRKSQSSFNMGYVKNATQDGCCYLIQRY